MSANSGAFPTSFVRGGVVHSTVKRMSAAVVVEKAPTIQAGHAATDTEPLLHKAATSSAPSSPPPDKPPAIRTYLWRWVILFLFSLNNGVTNYVWIMSAAVADVMTCYYGISETMLNYLTTSYMMVYCVLLFPTAWLMDKYGLRLPTVLGSVAMALGASLRVIGTGSQYYWMVLLGQFTASISNAIFFGGAPLLSETWFPSSERATATAISGAIAPQLGILIALGVTPVVIHSPLTEAVCNSTQNSSLLSTPDGIYWTHTIHQRWFYYQTGVAAIAVTTLLLTYLGFRNAPPTPPSVSRQLESSLHAQHHQHTSIRHELLEFVLNQLRFFKNFYFVLFLITSGIFLATAGALVAIINEIVAPYFPGHDEQIGYLGVVTEVSAIVAMLTIGRVLDWTKRFYLMNVILTLLGTGFLVAFVVLIQYQKHFYLLYIVVALVGATLSSYQALAYEYGVEMTYPLPEASSAGLINIVSQVVSIAMILLVTPKFKVFAMWFVVGTTALGAILAVFTMPKLKRVEIERKQA